MALKDLASDTRMEVAKIINPIIPSGAVVLKETNRPQKTLKGNVVLNGKALYNANANDLQNFELHPSEETDLVIKILSLAGITIKDQGLYQMGLGEDNKSIQQEKS